MLVRIALRSLSDYVKSGSSRMTAEELLKEGKLDDCLTQLKADIRRRPSDDKLRVFLAQLECILGNWDKALAQLKVAAEMDAGNLLLAQFFSQVINCELLRGEIFAGKRTPLVCGEPPAWLGLMVEANNLVAQEKYAAAGKLRNEAFEQAPAIPGSIDGQGFDWIADGDTRLGPIVEAILEGKYYWVPFTAIKQIRITAPTDLRDLVWTEAHFTWLNGGEATGLIPSRYPDSEKQPDDGVKLTRKTEWIEHPGETFLGMGQRMLTTDAGEFPILETRDIRLDHPDNDSEDSRD